MKNKTSQKERETKPHLTKTKSTVKEKRNLKQQQNLKKEGTTYFQIHGIQPGILDSIVETDNANGITPGLIEGGEFAVTFDGAARYSLPLWVPPGRLGIEPKLSLEYNSRSGNGLLGMGWSLSGISQITRGKKNFADDHMTEPVKFDQSDPYYLDGQRLILVSGINGTEGAEYRTKNDEFTKIIMHDIDPGPQGQILGPSWFEARHKDGRIFIYGGIGKNDFGSRFEGPAMINNILPGGWRPGSQAPFDRRADQIDRDRIALDYVFVVEMTVRFAWSLSSVRDRAENEMLIYYDVYASPQGQPVVNRDYLPAKILYTGSRILNNGSQVDKTPPLRTIEFIWEDRTDHETRFISGLRLTQKKRLAEIRMSGPDPIVPALLRKYVLSYVYNTDVSKRSLLLSVQESDRTDVSKGKHSFEWELGKSTFCQLDTKLGVNNITSMPRTRAALSGRIRIADFNGDGRDDILYINPSNTKNFWMLLSDETSPTGFRDPIETIIPVPSDFKLERFNPNGQVYIFKDAASDFINILVFDNSNLFSPTYKVYHAGIDFKGTIGNIPGAFVVFPGKEIFSSEEGHILEGVVEMADFDGDGLPDLLLGDMTGFFPEWYCRLNQAGDLNFQNEQLVEIFPSEHYFINLNGDNVTSILTSGSSFLGNDDDPRYSYIQLKSIAGNINQVYGLTLLLKDNQYFFANLNGSGLPCAFSLGTIINDAFQTDSSVSENIGGNSGFIAPTTTVVLPFLTQLPGQASSDLAPLIRVIDFDQDGCDELIIRTRTVKDGDGTGNDPMYLLKMTDNGMTQTLLDLPFINIYDNKDQFEIFEVLDYSGKGLGDIVMFTDKQLSLFIHDGNKADMMIAVVDGLGARLDIKYSPISDPAIHTPGSGLIYPTRSISSKIWVVSQYEQDNGIGGVNTTQLKYQGGVEDYSGDGFLGFAGRDVLQVEKNISTHTTYFPDLYHIPSGSLGEHFYPLLGLPIDETIHVQLSNKSERVFTNQYEYKVIPDPNQTPYFVFASKIVEQVVENLNGIPTMPTRIHTITQDLDGFGNIIQYNETWGDGNQSGYTATYFNDTFNWLIGLMDTITETNTTPNGIQQTRTRAYEYDYRGMLTRTIIEPGVKDINGYQPMGPQQDGVKTLFRSIGRYSNGNIYQVTEEETIDAIGVKRINTFIYDDLEHIFPVEISNSFAQHVRANYHPGLAVVTTIEDENGVKRLRQYDGFGRLSLEVAPDGSDLSLHYSYNPNFNNSTGMQITLSIGGGPLKIKDFDVLGRKITETTYSRDDGAAVAQDIEYDAFGRQSGISLPHFKVDPAFYNQYIYDSLDRVTSIVNADGSGSTTKYIGESIISTDVKGNKATFRIDNLDRVIFSADSDARYYGKGFFALLGMKFEYGPFNTLINVTDIPGNQTITTFDRLGRPIDLQDPDRGHRIYSYNAFGNLEQEIKGNTQQVNFYYDSIGRLYEVKDPIDGDVRIIWDTAANGIGKISRIVVPGERVFTDFIYDIIGRLTSKMWMIDKLKYSINLTFDVVGRPLELIYPRVDTLSPFTIKYQYGKFGQLLGVWDESINLPYWMYLSMDASEKFGKELLGNGLVNSRNENLARPGVLESIQTFDNTNNLIKNLSFEFDRNLNLKSRNDQIQNTKEIFEYDQFDRLHRWTWNGNAGMRKTRWDYDGIGNISKRAIEAGPGNDLSYTYNAAVAGPHAVISTELGAYTYDLKGNQVSGPSRKIAFGRGDLPIQITRTSGNGQSKIRFVYDGEMNRIRTMDSTTNQVIDTIGRIYEYRRVDPKQSVNGVHTFNMVVNGQLIARRHWKIVNKKLTNSSIEYVHTDHQGSIDLISDENGKLLESLKYDPFGLRVDVNDPAIPLQVPNFLLPTGYTSQEHVDGWDLIDMKGRFYDPILGKFLTPDPFVPNPLKPQSWNRYAYVLNNPSSWKDPTGFIIEKASSGSESLSSNPSAELAESSDSSSGSQSSDPQSSSSEPSGSQSSGSQSSGSDSSGVACGGGCPPPPPSNDDGMCGPGIIGSSIQNPPNIQKDPVDIFRRMDQRTASRIQQNFPFANPLFKRTVTTNLPWKSFNYTKFYNYYKDAYLKAKGDVFVAWAILQDKRQIPSNFYDLSLSAAEDYAYGRYLGNQWWGLRLGATPIIGVYNIAKFLGLVPKLGEGPVTPFSLEQWKLEQQGLNDGADEWLGLAEPNY